MINLMNLLGTNWDLSMLIKYLLDITTKANVAPAFSEHSGLIPVKWKQCRQTNDIIADFLF